MYHAPKVSVYAEEADETYTPLAQRVTPAAAYAEVAHDLRHFDTVLGPVRSLHTPHALAPAAAALVVVYADYVDPRDHEALLDRIAFCDCPAHRERAQRWADRAARVTAGRLYRALAWCAGAVDGIGEDLSYLRLRIARRLAPLPAVTVL